MPVSRGEGWVFSCLSSYILLVHVQGDGTNLSIYHSRLLFMLLFLILVIVVNLISNFKNLYIFKALNETKNLIQYISHQYQDLLYCNSSQYILSTYNSQHNNNVNVVLAMTMPYSGQG